MSTAALTKRQREIYDYICRYQNQHGYPPTRAEIAHHFGFRSANAAEQHLRALARKDMLQMIPGASRGIRLNEEAGGMPIVGRVAAGSPILAEAHVQGRFQLDPNLFTPRADYLLRVRGHSMREAGILDGDLLAVHRRSQAESGQIVVSRVNDEEVTVKRFHRRSAYLVRLLPENPDFDPIELDLRRDSLAIEGLGVGVLRLRA